MPTPAEIRAGKTMPDQTTLPIEQQPLTVRLSALADYMEDAPDVVETDRGPWRVAITNQREAAQRLGQLEAELRVTDELLAARQGVLDAIPECPRHGSCVPHALDWIKQAEAVVTAARAFAAAHTAYRAGPADDSDAFVKAGDAFYDAEAALLASLETPGAGTDESTA